MDNWNPTVYDHKLCGPRETNSLSALLITFSGFLQLLDVFNRVYQEPSPIYVLHYILVYGTSKRIDGGEHNFIKLMVILKRGKLY